MDKEVKGKIKKIDEIKTYGESGFRKREVVIATDEQYSQLLMIEFVQDKCDLLDSFKVGEDVTISINLRGREWINPEGEAKYFNSIQGWRVVPFAFVTPGAEVPNSTFIENEPDDLPF